MLIVNRVIFIAKALVEYRLYDFYCYKEYKVIKYYCTFYYERDYFAG